MDSERKAMQQLISWKNSEDRKPLIIKGARQVGKTWLMQECSAALNALKYFKEKANDYHVVAAGSLHGTLLAQPKSYPVGMVTLLELHPLYFDEFLAAIDEMPECVSSWAKHKNPQKITQIQKELIAIYENDFAKHNGKVNSGTIVRKRGVLCWYSTFPAQEIQNILPRSLHSKWARTVTALRITQTLPSCWLRPTR